MSFISLDMEALETFELRSVCLVCLVLQFNAVDVRPSLRSSSVVPIRYFPAGTYCVKVSKWFHWPFNSIARRKFSQGPGCRYGIYESVVMWNMTVALRSHDQLNHLHRCKKMQNTHNFCCCCEKQKIAVSIAAVSMGPKFFSTNWPFISVHCARDR